MAAPNKPDSPNKADQNKDANQAQGHNTTEKQTGENPNSQNAEEAPAAADATQQAAADQFVEDSRGKLWGDTTSSNGDKNATGYHGRDGGGSVPTETPAAFSHNPAPSEAAVDPNVAEEQREAQREEVEGEAGNSKPRTL